MQTSNFQIAIDNYFTSSVRASGIENTNKLPVNNQFNRPNNHEKQRVNTEQPNIINQYNMSMGAVDRMDQNILAYMFNVRAKKWW